MKQKIMQWCFVLGLGIVMPMVILNLYSNGTPNTALQECEKASLNEHVKVCIDDEIVLVELEEYVLGVVLAEMPTSFDAESLKSQAVLARTYCLKRAENMDKHAEYVVCTDPSCCQGYCDPKSFKGGFAGFNKAFSAVLATKGQVLTYGGKLIDATYFSCSGGRTEAAVAVWGKDIPYLQSVESPGEQGTEHYASTVILKLDDCSNKLGIDRNQFVIGHVTYTEGGGVNTIRIGENVFSGVEVRNLLGLKSTAFRMKVVGDDVVITAKGYGHRVGLSQYGANAMALAGYSYTEILSHYYAGTNITSLDG